MTDVVVFCGVRVARVGSTWLLDRSNWARLRLFLEPFPAVTLVAVETHRSGDDWVALPPWVDVVSPHADFHPRGSPGTRSRKIGFAWRLPAVAWRCRPLVRRAQVIGLVWLLEPTFFAGLALSLVYRKPFFAVAIGHPADAFALKAARARGLARRLYSATASLMQGVGRLLARRAAVLLVTGAALGRRLGAGIPFSTSLFSADHIVGGDDTCTGTPIRWVYAGALSEHKGVDTLLEALAIVRAQGYDHRAVLVGHQDPRFALAETIERLALHDAVEAVGTLPWENALGTMRTGDIFVFLSRHEGLPKAPLEAMSQGLPVVVTPTGAEQYVTDAANGLVVPVGDAASCAEAVLRVCRDSALRRRLIAGGLETARAQTYEAARGRVRESLGRAFPAAVEPRAWSGTP